MFGLIFGRLMERFIVHVNAVCNKLPPWSPPKLGVSILSSNSPPHGNEIRGQACIPCRTTGHPLLLHRTSTNFTHTFWSDVLVFQCFMLTA